MNYKKKRFKEELALQKKLYSDIGKLGGKATDEQIEQRKAAAEFIRMSAFEQYKLDTEQIKLDVKLRGEAEKKRKEAADKAKADTEKAREEAQKLSEVDQQTNDSLAAINKRVDEQIQKRIEAAEAARKAAVEAAKAIQALKQEVTEEEADISGIEKYLNDIQKAKESIAF